MQKIQLNHHRNRLNFKTYFKCYIIIVIIFHKIIKDFKKILSTPNF